MAVRCVIVDDNRDFLEAARSLLHRGDLEVVGLAATTAEAVDLVASLQPAVTLVDVHLGNESGLALARRLIAGTDGAHSTVILISTYAEGDLAELFDESGALAFLTKSQLSAEAVLDALPRDDGDPLNANRGR
ncbi:MAG: response regulator [Acidimicrobiales bacterium]|nr:response regulator [Acidimicrobiales bacterium]